MKKVFVIAILICSMTIAQTMDSLKFASTDSVDIRAMVQKQIEDARAKKVDNYAAVQPAAETKINVPTVKEVQTQATVNPFLSFIMNQPIQYLIYEVISLIITGFILVRRTIKNFGKSSKKNLKIKIGMMREEKVGGAKANPKMIKVRKFLKDNLEIFRLNDQQLAKTARQLNVSQGELLLAARLKFFEMKKM